MYKSPSSKGRGVVGVLEVDFVEPSHDKQVVYPYLYPYPYTNPYPYPYTLPLSLSLTPALTLTLTRTSSVPTR